MLMSKDFATFLRFVTGVVMLAVMAFVITLGIFGVIRLHDVIWPPHPLLCVQAHDEYHQTDNGTLVQVCTQYRRS